MFLNNIPKIYPRNAKLVKALVINEYDEDNTAVFCRNFAGNFKRQILQFVRSELSEEVSVLLICKYSVNLKSKTETV